MYYIGSMLYRIFCPVFDCYCQILHIYIFLQFFENYWVSGEGRPDYHYVQEKAAVHTQLLSIREFMCGWDFMKTKHQGKTQVVAHSLDNSPEKQIQTVEEIA